MFVYYQVVERKEKKKRTIGMAMARQPIQDVHIRVYRSFVRVADTSL